MIILSLKTVVLALNKTTSRGKKEMNYMQSDEVFEIQLKLSSLDYESVLLNSLIQAMSKYGAKSTDSRYFLQKNDLRFSNEDTSKKIHGFVDTIEKLFGPCALLFEIEVMKSIHQILPSFEYKPGDVDFSFEGYLESLKNYLSSL